MRSYVDYDSKIGLQFGRLTIIAFAKVFPAGRRPSRQLCLCDCSCGNQCEKPWDYLRSGETRSCGCLSHDSTVAVNKKKRTHGLTGTKLYAVWYNMMQRCYDKEDGGYPDYGGRGIFVCKRWHGWQGALNFANDMGEPGCGMMIERMDNDGPYSPENCKWATKTEQARNKRTTIRVIWEGKEWKLIELCESLGLVYERIRERYQYRGWDLKKAIEIPVGAEECRKRDKSATTRRRMGPGV